MEVGKLTVERRSALGKGANHKLRAQGLVPGVVYGASTNGTIEPFAVTVDVKALRASLDPVRKQNTIINLTVNGGDKPMTLSALVKDYQVDAIRRDIRHVDLLAINPDKEVAAHVGIEFVGKPKGAIEGGQIRILMRAIDVRAKPANIPVKFTYDVAGLDIGDVVHVSDIALPEGVTAITGLEQAVVTCTRPDADKADDAAAAAPAAAPAAAAKAAPAAAGKAAPAAAAKPAAKK